MRELTSNEIQQVSGGLDDVMETSVAMLGAGIALAGGPFTIGAAIALCGSFGLSSFELYKAL